MIYNPKIKVLIKIIYKKVKSGVDLEDYLDFVNQRRVM